MAYPTVAAPYGLQPINLVGGQVYAGQVRQIPIASGSSTDIFYGDIVALDTNGQLVKVTTTDSATNAVGVFLGCSYTNPATKQKLFSQYWPAGTLAQDAVAYVIDDPRVVFKAAVGSQATSSLSNTSSGLGYVNPAFIGTNMYPLSGTAGSTTTGDSGAFVTAASGANTATLPFRVIAVVPDTNVTATTFCEVIVKVNTNAYNTALGNNLS